jgi:hypothetical protein
VSPGLGVFALRKRGQLILTDRYRIRTRQNVFRDHERVQFGRGSCWRS